MGSCEYYAHNFREVLDQVQKLIDDFNLKDYSNLTAWVAELDQQVRCYHSEPLPGVSHVLFMYVRTRMHCIFYGICAVENDVRPWECLERKIKISNFICYPECLDIASLLSLRRRLRLG